MTGEILTYHERELSVQPINMSLGRAAKLLKDGESVIVQLEPGDGTHYCLLLTPCWAQNVAQWLGRFGIRESKAGDYLIANYLRDDDGGASFYVPFDFEEYDLSEDKITSGWTIRFFTWWFKQLWKEIQNLN